MSITIYMFHAIGEVLSDDWADVNYSFSKNKYIEFLEKSKSVTSFERLKKNREKSGIVMTFDDGHISNYWAAKYMFDGGYGFADFFINPNLVGSCNYMSWDQISELSALGMSIQSHGLDHAYLSECSDEELQYQLAESKRIIENRINMPVTILAPPGGRYDERTVRLAKELGYTSITSSEPGQVKSTDCFVHGRISVMKNDSVDTLLSATNPLSLIILKQKIKYSTLSKLKFLLGNERYEKIRWRILGEQK